MATLLLIAGPAFAGGDGGIYSGGDGGPFGAYGGAGGGGGVGEASTGEGMGGGGNGDSSTGQPGDAAGNGGAGGSGRPGGTGLFPAGFSGLGGAGGAVGTAATNFQGGNGVNGENSFCASCSSGFGAGGGGGGGAGFVGAVLPAIVGTNITGGAGGAGGVAGPSPGTFGGPGDAGSGGGGGDGAFLTGGPPTTLTTSILGGRGGDGGSDSRPSTAGFGGGGGAGVVDEHGQSITNNGFTILGGDGGNGGNGAEGDAGRSGGPGGPGVTGSNFTLTNIGGTIRGGDGGSTGFDPPDLTSEITSGARAPGGPGVIGSNIHIINSGTIEGGVTDTEANGVNGNESPQANAITFTGGTNSLELQAGYKIIGNVVGLNSSVDTLILGGSTNYSFDVSQIAPEGTTTQQYQDFSELEKTGISSWILNGTQTSTAPWAVDQGALFVEGSTALSETTVNEGGALHGRGTVGNTVINAGGDLVPGEDDQPGTSLTVHGNLTFAPGANYVVQLNPSTSTTTNVSGTATLAGNVVAKFEPGSYVNHTYTILTAADGRSGMFNALDPRGLPPDFKANLDYNSTMALLNIMAELVPEPPQPPQPPPGEIITEIPGGPELPAESAPPPFPTDDLDVGHAIDNFFNSGGTLPPQFEDLFNLTGTGLTNALSQIDGEAATGAERGAFELTNEFLNLMLDPYVATPAPAQPPPPPAVFKAPVFKAPVPTPRWTAWAAGFGGGGTANGNAAVGSNNVTTSTFGYAAGLDYHYSPDTVLGFALAGGGTNWGLAQGLGGGRSDAFLAGIYGITHQGPVYLAGALAFANNWFSTERTALGEQLSANFQGQDYAGRLEGGYRFAVPFASATIGVTPYGAIQTQHFHTPGYSETGAPGGFALSYDARNGNDTRSELGGRFDDQTTFYAMPLVLRAKAAWAHDWVSNPELNAAFESLPGSGFTVIGAPIPHNSALASASAELFFAPNWSVLAKFDGEFAANSQFYAGSGTLRYTW